MKSMPRRSGYTPKLREVPENYTPNWLDKMDHRYAAVRTLRVRFHALVQDCGGLEDMSYAQQALAKRAIHLEALIESMEAQLLRGENVDTNKWTNAVNSLTNLFRTLGVKARPRHGSQPQFRYISQIKASSLSEE